jgi:predicted RNA binding protein YcfA (HicA-like mRNA interferase family)/predicted RNase H-like HicB family nuclease
VERLSRLELQNAACYPAFVKVREIIKIIQDDGWFLARTRGSHRQFHHPARRGTVTVAGSANDDCPKRRFTVSSNKQDFADSMEHYLIVIEPSATGFGAFSPDVPGCVATGTTVEQTLSEMRAALAFHFEGITGAGEPVPEPKGLEHYLRAGEHVADPGDLLTTIPADELLSELSTATHTA